MIKELYSCPETIRAHCSAPLIDERLRYLQHCVSLGIKQHTLREIAVHLLQTVKRLDVCVGETVNLTQIESAAQAWRHSIRHHKNHSESLETTQRFVGHAVRFFRFLGWFEENQTPSHTHCDKVVQFTQYMRCERGWADETVTRHQYTINGFFTWIEERGTDFEQLNIVDVEEYLNGFQASGAYSRQTVRIYAQRIRTFIGYAEQQNWCQLGISDGILTYRWCPSQDIPKGISREQVERLLATRGTNQAAQYRARAVLMLLCTYGLRAGEVCALKLDDLDWHAGQLTVRRPKPGRTHMYPLSASVGEAIADYLQAARPVCEHRELFVTLRAPARPISNSIIYCIVERRMTMIGVSDQRKGPHALRHGTAQHLLDQGMSMKTVGDYLGHRSADSTAVYAKVNLNMLREVAVCDLEGLL